MDEQYVYIGSPAPFVPKGRDDIMTDLREIAVEISEDSIKSGVALSAIKEYQRQMNDYMRKHGIVFYQP